MEKGSFDGPAMLGDKMSLWIRILDAFIDTMACMDIIAEHCAPSKGSLKFPVEKIDVLGIIEKQVFELKKH